jgi:ribose transport system permease protein/ribose transport system ATP-binding protein
MPLLLVVALMVAVGGYTQAKNSAFLTGFNLQGLFIAAIPLGLVAMGQTNALVVRVFDVSIGALVSVAVVIASFTISDGSSLPHLLLGVLAVFGACLVVGLFNVLLTSVLGLSSIIATLATYSILVGAALWMRPTPGGSIDQKFADVMLTSVGFMPVGFIAVAALAVAADVWLYRTGAGLLVRAVGLDEGSAARLGARVTRTAVCALLISSQVAALASLFVSSQVLVGDPNVGLGYTLTSIAAAVLGGASLAGGRGSYVGALIGGVFLTEITVIVPFLGWNNSLSTMLLGGLTLLALVLYKLPELLERLQGVRDHRGDAPSGSSAEAAAPTSGAPVA